MVIRKVTVTYLDYGNREHKRVYTITGDSMAEVFRITAEYIEDDIRDTSWDFKETCMEVVDEKT